MLFIDRKFRLPRAWSNRELKKFAHLFGGDVVNVSGWQDKDKEGAEYKDYFTGTKSYTITNYKTEAMGFQGKEGEIFLDLEAELPDGLEGRFDVVFNHTVLEHVFEVGKAFENLCRMSKDVVVLVTPFLQEVHAEYGDYWRMTPSAIKRLFEKNKMSLIYLNYNDDPEASVYIFSIATKQPERWGDKIQKSLRGDDGVSRDIDFPETAGSNAIRNRGYRIKMMLARLMKTLKGIWPKG